MDDKSDELQIKASGLSTSFTISFEDGNEKSNVIKQKRIIKTANMFTRKHYRTLSLPVANNSFFPKSETMKYGCEAEPNEPIVPEETSNPKNDCQSKGEFNGSVAISNADRYEEKIPSVSEEKSNNRISTSLNNKSTFNVSDSESEGGTYTIDKNNTQVKEARKSIDQVFGISSENQNDEYIPTEKKIEKRSRMVDEWIENNVSILKTQSNELSRNQISAIKSDIKSRTSKIPFPVEKSREPSSTNLLNGKSLTSLNGNSQNTISELKKKPLSSHNLSNGDENDTEQYLRETENIVSALQKRIKNEIKPQLRIEEPKILSKDQNGKEATPNKYSITRFNRAFSLRRDRSKKPSPVLTSSTPVPVRSKTFVGTPTTKTPDSTASKNIIKRNNSFCKDYSKTDISPKLKVTPRPKTSTDLGRKPSAKSTQQIELHNWKRRKNYDPMKAVAEEKKRKALAGAASNSVSSAHLKQASDSLEETDDLAAKIITRSASFHGLRNKNGYETEHSEIPLDRSSSNRSVGSYFMANDDDNDSEDHWVIPKPPSTSLQNTPPESLSSRLSLLSNAASNSSVLLLTSSTITKVDSATVSKVTQLSYKIKDTILALTNSISDFHEDIAQNSKGQVGLGSVPRSLYDRDNEITDNLCDETEDDLSFTENDMSADYQLNIALNNLNEIYQTIQKLHLKCAK